MECCRLGGEEMTGEVVSVGAAWIPLPTHEGQKGQVEVELTQQQCYSPAAF